MIVIPEDQILEYLIYRDKVNTARKEIEPFLAFYERWSQTTPFGMVGNRGASQGTRRVGLGRLPSTGGDP